MIKALSCLCVFSPFIGSILVGAFGRYFPKKMSGVFACVLLAISAVISLYLYYTLPTSEDTNIFSLFSWIDLGTFKAEWSFQIDRVSVVMLSVITIISLMVHIYSVNYMLEDAGQVRFMSYLSLFTFFMMILVTASNFLQLFFGWEGVGLASYLLIGFWYHKPTANHAALKAFVVNRVGDLFLILGIGLIYKVFGSMEFHTIMKTLASAKLETVSFFEFSFPAISAICLLLFLGCMGKSAQIGFHIWLPDAMEGPTPVSALLHSATMVAAGVFLAIRLSPLFEEAPSILAFVSLIGGVTAIFAGTMAFTQNDMKKIVAYSTCSQLGYMFVAIGVSAYAASLFHLMTHAFFKSLLFLGAGAVIHGMSGEQNIQKMGGLWRKMPWTHLFMVIGSLSLTGFPFFSGFYSKDKILEIAWGSATWWGHLSYGLGVVGVFLTTLYVWRLIIKVFYFESRADQETYSQAHEAPWTILTPLIILGGGSIVAGRSEIYNFIHSENFWGNSLRRELSKIALERIDEQTWVQWLPSGFMVAGLCVVFYLYFMRRQLTSRLITKFPKFYKFFANKWYVDELYHFLFFTPLKNASIWLWHKGDEDGIDRFGPNGIAKIIGRWGTYVRRLQRGRIYEYAFVMLLGIVGMLAWILSRYL
jgi:NADH-quinone oxidoreductase subunit L